MSDASSGGNGTLERKIRLVGAFAGLGSGLTKVAVGHGFDTVKIRQQCHPAQSAPSAITVMRTLVRKEGFLALYKGASSPAVGWTAIDSLLMGSLHNYRLFLMTLNFTTEPNPKNQNERQLSLVGHGMAGLCAGLTSATLATPMELLKVNLQVQQQTRYQNRQFTGPIDVARQIIRTEGVFPGLWRGFTGSLAQRTSFAWMFLFVEVFMRGFSKLSENGYPISPGLAHFLSGGFASFVYWGTAIAPDTVKNRMMAWPYPHAYATISTSGTLSSSSTTVPSRPTFRGVARDIYKLDGYRGFFRGLYPCLLRSFPVNASAYFVYEGIMSVLGAEKTRG